MVRLLAVSQNGADGGMPSMETFCPIRFEWMLNASVIRR
jgi:hypothetical protein